MSGFGSFRAVLRMHGSNNSKTSHESCSAITFRTRTLRVVIIATCAHSSIGMLFASTVFHCSALSVELPQNRGLGLLVMQRCLSVVM